MSSIDISPASKLNVPCRVAVGSLRPHASILLELKEATCSHHRKLESESNIWPDLSSPSGYRQLISKMFGIYSALEDELRMEPGIALLLPDLCQRWKTEWLRADLETLGIDVESCSMRTKIPRVNTTAAAFGCLYVLEGSTLGGQLISREVEAKLGFTPKTGCRFFSSYGAELGQMWRTFGQVLETFAATHKASHSQIVDSAIATFNCFIREFEGNRLKV